MTTIVPATDTAPAEVVTSRSTKRAMGYQLIGYGTTALATWFAARGYVSGETASAAAAAFVAAVPALIAAYRTGKLKTAIIGLIEERFTGTIK